MSNTRQDPLDFDGLAMAIAKYLKDVKPEVFKTQFDQVIEEYKGNNRWLPSRVVHKVVYYFTRVRGPELDKIATNIEELMKNDEYTEAKENDSTETEKSNSIIEMIAELLKKGQWYEGSVNTNLIRSVIEKLPPEYSNMQLTLEDINRLQIPLLTHLETQLQITVDENKKEFGEIAIAELEINEELKATKLDIFRKQGEIFLSTADIKELEMKQSLISEESIIFENEKLNKKKELDELKLQLQNLEETKAKREEELAKEIQKLMEEKQKCIAEIDAAKKAIMLLKPESNIKNLGMEETSSLVNELKQVGEDAIKMHLFNKKRESEKNIELKQQPRIDEKKAVLQSKLLAANETKSDAQMEKMKKIQEDCTAEHKDMSAIKLKLTNLLISKLPKTPPPKSQTTRKVVIPKGIMNKQDFAAELKSKLSARKIDAIDDKPSSDKKLVAVEKMQIESNKYSFYANNMFKPVAKLITEQVSEIENDSSMNINKI